ncbi:MAG TPA: NAD-dependent epimerase/dehydratase family protein [Nitrososphaerales archaeon]|nr:NAD-dependent epimerase/dehydratase family protein [Nitrososphaerales archaeon]
MASQVLGGKSFLVIGGAGFIGSHIVDALLQRGAEVMVLDDFSNGKRQNLPLDSNRLKVTDGDVRTFDFASLGKVDCIFNEAARALLPSFEDPVTDAAVNAGAVARVLEYARKNDIKVVHASSGSVYGNPVKVPISEHHPLNPISPYGASKLASESYCKMYHNEYGLDVFMLRYFNVYGPRQTVSEEMGVIPIFVKRALNKETLRIFGDGKQTRDFLNVADVVKANLLAYESKKGAGEPMNVGGVGEETTILELASTVMELCRYRAPVQFAPSKPGDIRRLLADNSLAKELIGYVPSVLLVEGLKDYIRHAGGS